MVDTYKHLYVWKIWVNSKYTEFYTVRKQCG